ncbi:hypothetical protein [Streptomyces sp. NBC_00893]|uniref:hypothetical protein n=1 Tax=Streptomyces sp. NBC_00893 TaxID=2975862 RepID=UPI002251B6BB|nr:hypothetical protein [Streptomyces sp. NBC_00893]MCX4846533.1 hypothetical protein [Streptomyces sp. NBC_00893]
MGKRERRRKRERAKKNQAQRRPANPEPIIWEFPVNAPRLRVVIKHDATDDTQRISVLYWEIKDDGTWARTVSSIGVASNIGALATAHSHATLLNCPCANCSEPINVTNRSWANKVGGKYLDVETPSYLCGDCTAIQKREEAERQQSAAEQGRVEREREQQKAEQLQRLIARAIEDEEGKTEPTGSLPTDDPLALALYVALISYATRNPGRALPSLTSVGPLGWTGDVEQDRKLLLALYYANLLAIAPESPSQAFTLSQDGDDIAFVSAEVAWRVIGGLAAAQERVKEIKYDLQTQPGSQGAAARDAFTALMDRMEVTDIAGYLKNLLTKKYGYPEVPEARREELTNVIRKGFEHGYTSGQMICFAWRAADSAAAWKERNPRMGPPEAASASVTSLNGKIDKAIELHHSIPEYETPRWHAAPLALSSFRRLHADVRWVYNREVIGTCTQCDHQGLKETVHPETGAEALWRCIHPVEIPAQQQNEEVPSRRDDAPDPADA